MEDLTLLSKGTDAQLEPSIFEIKELLKKNGFKRPARPAPEVR